MDAAPLLAADVAARQSRSVQMAERPESAPTQRNGRIQIARIVETLDNAIPLPYDARSFATYFGILLAVAAGMMIHVLLAAQILQTEVRLANMQTQHTVIERQNGELLWRIGKATNYVTVYQRARAAGYRPIDQRQFVEVRPDGVRVRATEADALAGGLQAQTSGPREATSAANSTSEAREQSPQDQNQTQQESADEEVPADILRQRLAVLSQWRSLLAPNAPVSTDSTPAMATETSRSKPVWLDQVVEYFETLYADVVGQ